MEAMARASLKLPQNVEGDLFVDSTCIDCDTCRQLAPEVFARADDAGMSYVHRQPAAGEERTRALMALIACPTASIGTVAKADTAEAARRFPMDVGGGVSFCGFTSKDSFGAWSWLVRRPEGNVLVVSHKATIRVILCALLGVDLNHFRIRVAAPVASLTAVDFRETGPLLTLLGDTSHLPEHLRKQKGT